MFILALKNLANNKLRLSLTALAIVLGVGFVVASFVLRDGLKDSFASLSEEIVGQTDLAVTSADDQPDLNQSNLETVRGLPGISSAKGSVFGDDNLIQVVLDDGTTIPVQGPPQIGFSWTDDPALNSNPIASGRAPQDLGEWIVDIDAAETHNLQLGDTYEFVTPAGKRSGELVGTFTFGADNTTNGATLYSFTVPTLRDYLELDDDYLTSIEISVDGNAEVEDVQEAVSTALGNPANTDFSADTMPDDVSVVVENQASLIANTQEQFNVGVDIFGGVLLGFALISLFVSVFIIANTFSIVTSQRVRELGLLRAIGATPGQIRASVLVESLMIGIFASALGLLAGVLLALTMAQLLELAGIPLPPFDVVLSPTTTIVAMTIGTVVTVVSALVPAFAASRTSPIAAISGTSSYTGRALVRYLLGGAAVLVGMGLVALGLVTGGDAVVEILTLLGSGAAVLFIGITMLSPLVASRICRTLGAPFTRFLGVPGELATENAARNPRRTATTAAALMIGLSLVSMALVVGESFKGELNRVLTSNIQADYIVSGANVDVPAEVVTVLDDEPTLDAVNAVRIDQVDLTNVPVDDQTEDPYQAQLSTLDLSRIDGLLNLGVAEGSLDGLDLDEAALLEDTAEELGLGLGDTVSVKLLDASVADLKVTAIFTESLVAGTVVVSPERFETASETTGASYIAAKRGADVDVADSDAAFAAYADEYPSFSFESSAEFRESLSSQIDTTLNLLTALLGLAIFIALLGISNTLALSVFERTREIGLLRAVGMSRRQLRRMIRLEASLISGLGAFLGAAIGISLGAVGVLAIPDTFVSQLTVPWAQIAVLVAVGSLAGLLAAILPAFRASRFGVLDAIETT